MEVVGRHSRQRSSLHLVRCLADGCHLRGFTLQPLYEPHEIAVADQRVAVQTKPRHGAHVVERVRGQMTEHVAVQKQTFQRGQIIERALLDLPQVVVMQV